MENKFQFVFCQKYFLNSLHEILLMKIKQKSKKYRIVITIKHKFELIKKKNTKIRKNLSSDCKLMRSF